MSKGDRCTGHCCEGFVLPLYEELPMLVQKGRADAAEVEQILGMVVLRRVAKPGEKLNDGSVAIEPTPVFGCRNFDAETRNCRIYETRPVMCRDYPYGKPCSFTSCTWDKGRAGLHDREPELVPLRRKGFVNPKVTTVIDLLVVRPKPPIDAVLADEPKLNPKPARPPLVVSVPTLLSQMEKGLKPKVPAIDSKGKKVGSSAKKT